MADLLLTNGQNMETEVVPMAKTEGLTDSHYM